MSLRRRYEILVPLQFNDGRPVPESLLWQTVEELEAQFGDPFSKATGQNFPLTSSRLKALLETTHFLCEKLLSTGFRHPQTTEEGLEEMVEWYRRSGGRSSED